MRKKVVFIVEAMLGGIRQHVCDIVENLKQDEYELWLIYSDLRADKSFFEEIPILLNHVHMIKCNEMQRSIGKMDYIAYKKICKILSEIEPDIVHCHSSKAGIVGRLAAKKCKINQIYYTPNAYAFQSPEISFIKKNIYVFAERYLSHVVTTKTINVSKGEMQLAFKFHIDKKDKFALIYNGIREMQLKNKNSIKNEFGFNLNRYLVGITARCAEQKDPMNWLLMAKKIISMRNDIDFIYIGDGPMQSQMSKWIKKEKLERRIKMLGFHADASQIVGMFDIYLSTALYEGLPYSMIEAMRAGVPIIATDVVGNNEIVVNDVNGWLYDMGDVEQAVKLIIRQIDNQYITEKMVKKVFTQKFSLNNMITNISNLYLE